MVITGWLLDIYEEQDEGLAIWMLGEDGQRHRLRQPFRVTFYISGPAARLRLLWKFLESQPVPVSLARLERRDLFQPGPVTVLAVEVAQAIAQPRLFQQAAQRFPELAYYDADIQVALRHAALYGTFPLARCKVSADSRGQIEHIEVLDSPWDLDPSLPSLRTLFVEPDTNPHHRNPTCLVIRTPESGDRVAYRLPLEPERPLLINLRAILNRHDPDVLLTTWGDPWLLPRLLEISARAGIELPLNRDAGRGIAYRRERSYFSYGQVIYRGQQFHLFGRWHIDCCNAMLFHDYGMHGILELARVTALGVQTVARVSPGTGISAMQILTALRQEILVPWHKQQAERPKTVLDLLRADQGGMVYQPRIGLHRNVAEIDFISMYPSIMARYNVSPETVGGDSPDAPLIPQLGLHIEQDRPGLVPQTLESLLKKRLAYKEHLAGLPGWDPRRKVYQARASAHKWLLVTCFGYLGYKNARFGRIEAHEAVTAYGREALLQAKEVAEEHGCTILHMYVDGLWVQKEGASAVADFQSLLEEIAMRTSLPVALDGVYRWVVFLPSRQDERVPVANRYFGVFQDGSLKIRGIEARREDTPPFIAQIQLEMLERLAKAPDASRLGEYLPGIFGLLRRRLAELRRGQVPLEKLLVSQKLSRTLDEYRSPSPAARAVAQLQAAGKSIRPGQRVRFLYTLGEPGVHAWDAPEPPKPASLDLARYRDLLLRAANTVLEPFRQDKSNLRDWLVERAVPLKLPAPGRTRLAEAPSLV